MDKSKLRLFHTTREVEMHFDSFLDTVSQGGLAFRSAIGVYLDSAANDDLAAKLKQLNELEHKGDELRRQVEQELYTMALIPDFRGDVLSSNGHDNRDTPDHESHDRFPSSPTLLPRGEKGVS
jgi:uncharacterized protein Yka (UPF0111/DUF47 family)